MDVIEAILARRATRSYLPAPIDDETIRRLLTLAAEAPSAMNGEPWAFVVEHDRALMKDLSARAVEHIRSEVERGVAPPGADAFVAAPGFDMFYGAPVLIVICATSQTTQAACDCYLAGENLMLAATGLGLATCPIGFAIPVLRTAEIREKLAIPKDYDPILPIVVGHPEPTGPLRPDRRQTIVLHWN